MRFRGFALGVINSLMAPIRSRITESCVSKRFSNSSIFPARRRFVASISRNRTKAHHKNAHLDGPLGIEHGCGHDRSVLGERIGSISAPAAAFL